MHNIYKISELTSSLKAIIEKNYPFVWLEGQITNLSRPSSGHLYFSLKDEQSSIAAVWFKSSQCNNDSFDALTGEVYEMGKEPSLSARIENGMEVICAGKITVYPPRGSYQIVVQLVQEAGQGKLQLELELLKAELARLGYFDPQRKRKLPINPKRVAVVSSLHGAAIHDFVTIASSRGLPSEIKIYPVLVQGEAAPLSIANAISMISAEGWAEVVVVIRGGGSQEDLSAFNAKIVAEKIFTSTIPVLCGVGHEVDTSFADMTADVRAATPSHAAQLLFMDKDILIQKIDEVENSFVTQFEYRILLLKRKLDELNRNLKYFSPYKSINKYKIDLSVKTKRVVRSIARKIDSYVLMLDSRKRLVVAPELKINKQMLEVAAVTSNLKKSQNNIIYSYDKKLTGLAYRVRSPIALVEKVAFSVEKQYGKLNSRIKDKLISLEKRLEAAISLIDKFNPELPFTRGYALVVKNNGVFVRSKSEVSVGETLTIRLLDGTAQVVVSDVQENKNK